MKPKEIQKAKGESLIRGLLELGYGKEDLINREQLEPFLDMRAREGEFDPALKKKLYNLLSIEDPSQSILVSDFIISYLQFDEALKRNAEAFEKKSLEQANVWLAKEDEINKYRAEINRNNGIAEDAIIRFKINDVKIDEKLAGIDSLNIYVIFNDVKKSLYFKMGSQNNHKSAKMEFKPKSKLDNFEIILEVVNEKGKAQIIGRKNFPLDKVENDEEYTLDIKVPEIDDENQTVAFVYSIILIHWSDLAKLLKERNVEKKKAEKLHACYDKAKEYSDKAFEIYGDLRKKKPDLVVDFNNEVLVDKEGDLFEVNLNNEKENPPEDFDVVFNNQIKKENNDYEINFENEMKRTTKGEESFDINFQNEVQREYGEDGYSIVYQNEPNRETKDERSYEIDYQNYAQRDYGDNGYELNYDNDKEIPY